MLAFKYAFFAAISIGFNLFSQAAFLFFYDGFLSLYGALAFGTIAGLIVKYLLDKNYIFYHKSKSVKDDGQKFLLYSFMGLFTTAIFWGFEIGFDAVLGGESAKYIGGFLGLSIGYFVKYELDKRFVFKAAV